MFFVRCGSVFFFKAPFLEHKFGGFLKIKTCKLRNNMICLVHITIVGMRHVKIIYASCESCAYTLDQQPVVTLCQKFLHLSPNQSSQH